MHTVSFKVTKLLIYALDSLDKRFKYNGNQTYAKGQYIQCDLYHMILLYYYASTKGITHESENLKGVVYNLLHCVDGP